MSVKDNLTLSELYAQLLSYEARLLQQISDEGCQFYSSANKATHGRGRGSFQGRGRGSGFPGRGTSSGRGTPPGRSSTDNSDAVMFQLCERTGHTVHDCWDRFKKNYVPPQQWVQIKQDHRRQQPLYFHLMVLPSYAVDTNWYMDSGATDHITSESEKLTTRQQYTVQDQIHAANGKGMDISHIGNTIIRTPKRDFSVNHILHAPTATKKLVSVHKFATNNHVFLEFIHPTFFCVKDLDTKHLLRGSCHDGLYPLPTPTSQVHHVTKPTLSRWHHRLGHPSSAIVTRVLKDNNLSVSSESCTSFCNACQQAKSHQLPYLRSSSVSSSPLQLIFFDVWGPAPQSVVSLHGYIWLRIDLMFFKSFLIFNNMLNGTFNKKILTVQTDWGGVYQKLHSLFQKIGIDHHVSCPHAHQQNGSAERKCGSHMSLGTP
ncbi:hypothetical protein U9M48_040122 [Paspalum notatum var. saurae]|uniref:GAG-pre-integrase domain-containing protein n=1 Tax=Paspalum notatum var. saurae TaxID=547442 RepID=A0AAQ3ULG4_PASNO